MKKSLIKMCVCGNIRLEKEYDQCFKCYLLKIKNKQKIRLQYIESEEEKKERQRRYRIKYNIEEWYIEQKKQGKEV